MKEAAMWPATPSKRSVAWPERLAAALAGNETQVAQPMVDRLHRAGYLPPTMPAAVLVAVLGRDEPGVLFTRRRDDLTAHAGQVAFPGGAEEPGDANPEATALREAEEEVALARERVRVLGRLPRYPTTTGYLVTPVVGWVADPPVFTAQASEVADIFVVPLAVLLDRSCWRSNPLRLGNTQLPHRELQWQGRRIWGATAGMLQLLLPSLRAARADDS